MRAAADVTFVDGDDELRRRCRWPTRFRPSTSPARSVD